MDVRMKIRSLGAYSTVIFLFLLFCSMTELPPLVIESPENKSQMETGRSFDSVFHENTGYGIIENDRNTLQAPPGPGIGEEKDTPVSDGLYILLLTGATQIVASRRRRGGRV
jgi:hypothetical protein